MLQKRNNITAASTPSSAATVTYGQLVERLADIGVTEKEVNIRNKLSRGKFTAAFMMQCLIAIGCSSLHLGGA
jgi:hypothetical protein